MSEIRVLDLPESLTISDNDYFLLEQNDGTKKAKGLIINKKIRETNENYLEISKEIRTARGDKENLNLKLIDMENRAAENVAKQYLECGTDNGHMKVENCFNGKTKDLVVKGRTLQNILPYNLINYNGNNANHVDLSLFKPNTLYTFIFTIKNVIGSPSGVWCRFQETPTPSKFVDVKDAPFTEGVHIVKFTTPESWKNGYIGWFRNGLSNQKIDMSVIALEDDHTENPPTDYFEGIKSLGEEENKISILSRGKNLLNDSLIKAGRIDDGVIGYQNDSFVEYLTNGIKCTTNVRWRGVYSQKLFSDGLLSFKIEKSSNVTSHAGSISYYDNKDNFTRSENIYSNQFNKVIKKSVNEVYCRFSININEIGGFSLTHIQLEEGTTATPYEPYQEDKKDILLPVQYGAKGFENGVADESYDDGDYLQRIERTVLSGNDIEKWMSHPTSTDTIFVAICDVNVFKGKKNGGTSISDKFKCGVAQGTGEGISLLTSLGCYLGILKSKLETPDIDGFKTWLQANPTTVYYELAEPVLHKAETPTDVNPATFLQITNVSCLNKIAPSEIKAKFPVDTAATFSRLNRENKELEKENVILKNDLLEQAEHFNNKDKEINDYTLDMDFKVCLMEMDLEDIKLQLGDGINVKK